MGYKRLHVRVPITAEATLSSTQGEVSIKARTIDISQGGLSITNTSEHLENHEYQVQIETSEGQTIAFTASLMRKDDHSAGFRTLHIDKEYLATISELVENYQTTVDFINQVAEFELFQQHIVDDDGTELEVTFDLNPKKP